MNLQLRPWYFTGHITSSRHIHIHQRVSLFIVSPPLVCDWHFVLTASHDESLFCTVNKSRKLHRLKKNHSHRPLFKLTPLASRFPLQNRVQKLPLFVWEGRVISNARVLFVDVHYSLILEVGKRREYALERVEEREQRSIVGLHLPPHEFAI